MSQNPRVFDRHRLLLGLWLLLTAGFVAITLIGYQVSKEAIRNAIIEQELPLTSSNIYSEIQKDLVRPVLISSTMANDTFLRDWVLDGERNVDDITRYLREVKTRYGAFSSFFVSEKTSNYYTGEGILKRVSADEPRDRWYYRVREMKEAYEINVDPDMANKDALTIFINYRVFDFQGNYIGTTGIGLTVDSVRHLIAQYQERYSRTIYFVDAQGKVVLFASQGSRAGHLRETPGLTELAATILADRGGSYQYTAGGDGHILNVSFMPELKWYLLVEQNEARALAGIRRTLYTNLAISGLITVIVLLLGHVALTRYQRRIEDMAVTDKLTGLFNRQAFGILSGKLMAEYRREPKPFAVLLADLDHFKQINDQYGHQAGDGALVKLAQVMRENLRESDIAVRWGGEEFLLLLRGCELVEAARIAETLRQRIEATSLEVPQAEALRITTSLGVAQFSGDESIEQLINRADIALYRAKEGGRNRCESAPMPSSAG